MIICLLIAIFGFAIYAVSSIVTDRLLERRIKDIEEKMNGFVKRLDILTIEDNTPTKIASLDSSFYKELGEKYGATSGSDMTNGLSYEQSKCSTCINDKGCINCENGNQYENSIKVKEVDLKKEFYDFLDTLIGKDNGHLSEDELFCIAEYFFELGLKARKGE